MPSGLHRASPMTPRSPKRGKNQKVCLGIDRCIQIVSFWSFPGQIKLEKFKNCPKTDPIWLTIYLKQEVVTNRRHGDEQAMAYMNPSAQENSILRLKDESRWAQHNKFKFRCNSDTFQGKNEQTIWLCCKFFRFLVKWHNFHCVFEFFRLPETLSFQTSHLSSKSVPSVKRENFSKQWITPATLKMHNWDKSN